MTIYLSEYLLAKLIVPFIKSGCRDLTVALALFGDLIGVLPPLSIGDFGLTMEPTTFTVDPRMSDWPRRPLAGVGVCYFFTAPFDTIDAFGGVLDGVFGVLKGDFDLFLPRCSGDCFLPGLFDFFLFRSLLISAGIVAMYYGAIIC